MTTYIYIHTHNVPEFNQKIVIVEDILKNKKKKLYKVKNALLQTFD